MFKQIIKLSAAFAVSFGLIGGVALADSSITNTGFLSHNSIKNKNINVCKDINKNNVGVLNGNFQFAKTGKVKVAGNTTGGSATSGDATNGNSTTVGVDITNTNGCSCCECGCPQSDGLQGENTISGTGALSSNKITNLDVNKSITVNKNNVLVGNLSVQSAKSGDATVWGNTTGGDATSGDASSTNSTGVTILITNN